MRKRKTNFDSWPPMDEHEEDSCLENKLLIVFQQLFCQKIYSTGMPFVAIASYAPSHASGGGGLN